MTAGSRFLRTVRPVAVEELQHMPTRALLKRLEDLRRLHETCENTDWDEAERDAVNASGLIAFKDTAIWKQAYADLKAVLQTRDHVDRGGKQARRRDQQEKQRK
ncbi:hypothetical protein [Roseibium sp.]|uniref:hypothetical protein n=1 Tax=Roseibium sp. TaxID=1936156 RepID=UPI003A96C128